MAITFEDLRRSCNGDYNRPIWIEDDGDVTYDSEFNEILYIGEAWGKDEESISQPFVGRAGGKLKGILNELKDEGIPTADWQNSYITNVFNFRPGTEYEKIFRKKPKNYNDISLLFAPPNSSDVNGLLPAFRDRLPYGCFTKHLTILREKITRIVKPKMIITLGAIPLWALTGRDRILVNTDKVLHNTPGLVLDGTNYVPPIYVCGHPSYHMRNGTMGSLKNSLRMAHQWHEENCHE